MKDFTIALIQHASPIGRKEENLRRTISWAKKARKAGAELACFPELNITGHAGHPDMVKEAEPVPGGPSCQALCALARELGLHLCAGIAEEDRGLHYNTQLLVGPKGYVGKQRKVHLSADEYFHFRGGAELPVFELPMGRVGIVICYDNLVPEVARCLAVQGAEVVLCPHAARTGKWHDKPAERRKVVEAHKKSWRMVHSCRAYDNGVYVALCNTAGRSAAPLKGVEANHAGGCMVVDPKGEVIAESRSKDIRDEMLLVPLKGEAVAERRRQTCFNLQTRRPEAFGVLTKPTT